MTRTVDTYIAEAQDALAAGFTSKAAQKGALDNLSRGYDLLRDAVRDRHLREAPAHIPDNVVRWRRRVDYLNARDLPFQLNHVREQHSAYLNGEEETQLTKLITLRGQVKAAPIAPKPPSRPRREVERDGKTMTCQICARPILAQTGVIAHHGYQRPWHGSGYQTSSCRGARHLPFEASRDELGAELVHVKAELIEYISARHKLAIEQAPAVWTYHDRREAVPRARRDVRVYVTRDKFASVLAAVIADGSYHGRDAITFDAILTVDLAQRDQTIAGLRSYITRQQARYDGWAGVTHRFADNTWSAA